MTPKLSLEEKDGSDVSESYGAVEQAWLEAMRERLNGTESERVQQMMLIHQLASSIKGCREWQGFARSFAITSALYAKANGARVR